MKYIEPQMEVISVRLEDIIQTSNPGNVVPGGDLEQPGGSNPGEGYTPVQPF